MLQRFIPSAWQRYVSPGQPGRPTTERELRVIYGTWLFALVLKLIGSTWDVAWHFHYLRDDFAPPHNINTVGTIYVILLVLFHTWTGFGVDRKSLRWMQAGITTFLVAIPLDLINHRLFGLDITAWSPTHMLLYVGTVIMVVGVLRGWYLYAQPGRFRIAFGTTFWALLLEGVLFPLGQHEYGVHALAALRSGSTTASPELLAEAARYGDPAQFVLPVPMWVYPTWLIIMGTGVLLLARLNAGWRWTATTVAVSYVGYRWLAYYLLLWGGFPASTFPIMLVGAALMIDVAVQRQWQPVIGLGCVLTMYYVGAWLLQQWTFVPDFSLALAPLIGLSLWLCWVWLYWVEDRQIVARWMASV